MKKANKKAVFVGIADKIQIKSKRLGWLKEISVLAIYIITANYGIA